MTTKHDDSIATVSYTHLTHHPFSGKQECLFTSFMYPAGRAWKQSGRQEGKVTQSMLRQHPIT